MKTPIIAVHLFYAQGMFPAHEKLVHGESVLVPALLEETWCVKCIRQAWHLTPEEGDADLVKAARHMTKEAHLAERVDLLEEDMIEPAEFHCKHCGAPLVTSRKDSIQRTTIARVVNAADDNAVAALLEAGGSITPHPLHSLEKSREIVVLPTDGTESVKINGEGPQCAEQWDTYEAIRLSSGVMVILHSTPGWDVLYLRHLL